MTEEGDRITTPRLIADLAPADAERLAGLIADATARQAKALDEAIDGGMGHIPRLLRGPVKAVLFR